MSAHLKVFEDAEASRRAASYTRHFEWLLALCAGLLGLLAVVGPDAFQQGVLSIVGSLLGGLLIAVGVCCLFSPPHREWAPEEDGVLGSMWGFIKGDGDAVGYVIWALTSTLGLMRWHLGVCLEELGTCAERYCPVLWQELTKGAKKRRSGNRGDPRRASASNRGDPSRTPSEEIRYQPGGR